MLSKTLRKNIIALTLVLTTPFLQAQQYEIQEGDPIFDEMMKSPDIFDPASFEEEGQFKFPEEAYAIMMDDQTIRVPVIEDVEFPLISEGLSPAQFEPFQINDPNMQMGEIPLCILGTDQISKQWLEIRKHDLYQNMVTCLVIEAKNENEISQLQKIAPNVFFNAMEASWLKFIHIEHYPAIIFQNEVFQ